MNASTSIAPRTLWFTMQLLMMAITVIVIFLVDIERFTEYKSPQTMLSIPKVLVLPAINPFHVNQLHVKVTSKK